MQWTEFSNCEISRCNRSIIYPIFGWDELNKDDYNRDNNKIKEYLKCIEKELEKNEFIIGNKITLADISLFAKTRFLMMFHLPEQMRNKLFPKLNKWFENLMNTKEAMKAYGRTVLCKTPMKPFAGKINKNKPEKENKENKEEKGKNNDNKEKDKNKNKKDKKEKKDKQKDKKENEQKDKPKQEKKEKEKEPYIPGLLEVPRFNIKEIENNPLDSLPPSKFDLSKFKEEFINSKDKATSLNNFWTNFDQEGYSLWYIEYNNSPNECVTLFRTCVIKGDILEQLKYFKKYCFGVLGAYGGNGAYKIKGCLLWRGKDIPEEIKAINCFNKMTFRKLDCNVEKDKELVKEYWTKINENEKVFDLPAIDARYYY
jgi:elongation factor 1-gamma